MFVGEQLDAYIVGTLCPLSVFCGYPWPSVLCVVGDVLCAFFVVSSLSGNLLPLQCNIFWGGGFFSPIVTRQKEVCPFYTPYILKCMEYSNLV